MIEMTFYNDAFSIQFCVIHLRCNIVLQALVYYSGILFTRVFALIFMLCCNFTYFMRISFMGDMYLIELSLFSLILYV